MKKNNLSLIYAAYIAFVNSDMTFQQILNGEDMSVRIAQQYHYFNIGDNQNSEKIKSIIHEKCNDFYGEGKWNFDYGIGILKSDSKHYPKEGDLVL